MDNHKNSTISSNLKNPGLTADSNIDFSLKEKNWARLWEIINAYVKNKNETLKELSSKINELADKEQFKEIEWFTEWLTEEKAVYLYIALIYKAAVINGDTESGNYFLSRLKEVPVSNYPMTEYEWYMVVESEAAGTSGLLDAVKDITNENDKTFLTNFSTLYKVTIGNKELQRKLINHAFYNLWEIGNYEGIFDMGDYLPDFIDDLIASEIKDKDVWDKVLKVEEMINGAGDYPFDELPKPLEKLEVEMFSPGLISTLLRINPELEGYPTISSILDFIGKSRSHDEDEKEVLSFLGDIKKGDNYFRQCSALITIIKYIIAVRLNRNRLWESLLDHVENLTNRLKTDNSDHFDRFPRQKDRILSMIYSICALLSYKKREQDNAYVYWQKASDHLKKIENDIADQIRTISILAWSYHNSEMKYKSLSLMEKADRIYKNMEDRWSKSNIKKFILRLFEGVECLNNLFNENMEDKDQDENMEVLNTLISEGKYEKALAEISKVSDKQEKSSLLLTYIERLPGKEMGSKKKAFLLWAKNIDLTEKSIKSLERPNALGIIVLHLLEEGKEDEALAMLKKACALRDPEYNDESNYDLIAKIVFNLFENEKFYSKVFEEVIAKINEMKDNFYKIRLLNAVSWCLYNNARKEEAIDIWVEALQLLKKLVNKQDMTETVNLIIQDFLDCELKENKLVAQCLAIAGKIEAQWKCPESLIQLLRMLLTLDFLPPELLEGAAVIAEKINNVKDKITIYVLLAQGFSCTGKRNKAEGYLQKAHSLADEMEDNREKPRYLREVAMGYGEIGLIEEGLAIGKKIDDVKEKAEVLSFSAYKFAQIGEKKSSEIIFRQSIGTEKPYNRWLYLESSLGPVLQWAIEGGDKEITNRMFDKILRTIDDMLEVYDRIYALNEVIKRITEKSSDSLPPSFIDIIEDKMDDYIYELINKNYSEDMLFVSLLRSTDILFWTKISKLELWKIILGMTDRITLEMYKITVLKNIAYSLRNLGIMDESIISLLEKSAQRLRGYESKSNIYYNITRMYLNDCKINQAIKALNKIPKKDDKIAAATCIIDYIIKNRKLEEEEGALSELIKLFKDYPEYFSNPMIPRLLDFYYPDDLGKKEELLSSLTA